MFGLSKSTSRNILKAMTKTIFKTASQLPLGNSPARQNGALLAAEMAGGNKPYRPRLDQRNERREEPWSHPARTALFRFVPGLD